MNPLLFLSGLAHSRAALVSAILCLVYYLVGFDDGGKIKAQIAAKSSEKQKIETETAAIDRQIEELRVLKAAQDRDAARLESLLKFIPEKLTKVDLMRALSNEAKAVGVSLAGLKDTGAPKVGDLYEELSVNVDITGSFAQLMMFLANLTRLPNIVSVSQLEISYMATRGQDDVRLKMASTVVGYKYLGNEAVAKAEAAAAAAAAKARPAAPAPRGPKK